MTIFSIIGRFNLKESGVGSQEKSNLPGSFWMRSLQGGRWIRRARPYESG